jgi:hypothetical protein
MNSDLKRWIEQTITNQKSMQSSYISEEDYGRAYWMAGYIRALENMLDTMERLDEGS